MFCPLGSPLSVNGRLSSNGLVGPQNGQVGSPNGLIGSQNGQLGSPNAMVGSPNGLFCPQLVWYSKVPLQWPLILVPKYYTKSSKKIVGATTLPIRNFLHLHKVFACINNHLFGKYQDNLECFQKI